MVVKRQKCPVSIGCLDSGLIVVVSIIVCMLLSVFFVLLYVQYEWCPVLFKNFTVSADIHVT